MNKKVKYLLISILILFIIGLIFYIIFDLRKNLINNENKEGFEILLPDNDICAVAIKGNTLWAGGAQGLFEVDISKKTSKKIGDYKFVRAVYADEKGIWVGHDDGLTLIGENSITYTTKNGLPDNRVNAIMKDNDNRIWAGTWGGAAVIDGENLKTYTETNGLIDNMVNVIMQDSFGGIWFGSYVAPRGGISLFYKDKWQYFTTENALLHSNINAIIQLRDKSVIAGGGLYNKGGAVRFSYQNNEWVKTSELTKKDGLAGEKVRSLFEDSQNRLWAGSEYDGLVVMTEDKKIILTQKNGLSNDEVKVIREDENNNIWVGTRKGLIFISKEVRL